jgi:hypothetical protein
MYTTDAPIWLAGIHFSLLPGLFYLLFTYITQKYRKYNTLTMVF